MYGLKQYGTGNVNDLTALWKWAWFRAQVHTHASWKPGVLGTQRIFQFFGGLEPALERQGRFDLSALIVMGLGGLAGI